MSTLEVETEVTVLGTIGENPATLIKDELLKAIGAAVKSECATFESAASGNSRFIETYTIASSLSVKIELSVNRRLSGEFLEMVVEYAITQAAASIAGELALQSIESVVDFVGDAANEVKTLVSKGVSSVLSSAKQALKDLSGPPR